MKLNFMHILADLGFDGAFPIYLIKESKNMPYNIHLVNMHAQDFLEPKEIQFGQNTKKDKGAHEIVKLQKVVQIISKNQINTRLTPKFN
jgi:hypothetical protein